MRTRIPFGYQFVNGKAVPNPEEAPKVKALFNLYLSGLSIKQAGALAEIHLSPGALKRILINPIYGGADPFYPPLVPSEISDQAIRRVAIRYKPQKRKARQPLPVDTEFIFARQAQGVEDVIQSLFDRIIPLKDATPVTLHEYMSGLTASDYMSGAFDFSPDMTVLPMLESN